MNVDYDLLTWEGDILRLKFWAQAFDVLKASGAVYLQTEGRLAGCWVMPIQEDEQQRQGPGPKAQVPRHKRQQSDAPRDAATRGRRDEEEAGEREKVIVRSNGVVTYVGKDIAYQFWKLGLLGRDFHYRVFARPAAGSALGHHLRQTAKATIQRSAALPTSTTSSTSGSRIFRSC